VRRRIVLAGAAVAAALTGSAAVAITSDPALTASGPVTVSGTEASAIFTVAERHIRQVRYADRETLSYAFALVNDGRFDLTVHGLGQVEREATLLRLVGLTDEVGDEEFTVGAGDHVAVVLDVLMTDCERLSARASSLVTSIPLEVTGVAGVEHEVSLALPEELRTGSAREMFCPRATAKSRPPG